LPPLPPCRWRTVVKIGKGDTNTIARPSGKDPDEPGLPQGNQNAEIISTTKEPGR
jgi:hypothetical protein